MSYQLLVLDIDGTVNDSEQRVTAKTKRSVIDLQRRGVRVVLASGRPPLGIFPVASELKLDQFGSYIMAFNGAKIMEYGQGRCIFERHLPFHLPARLWEDVRRYEVGFAAYHGDVIVAGTRPDQYLKLESEICKMTVEYRERFGAYVDFPVSECLITGEPEELEMLEMDLSHKYVHEAQLFHSEPHYLEVTPKNVDKAYGLKHLLKILHIPRENTVCCGNSFNDRTMIQYAGVGVAMANAVEPLKIVADYVTVNDNDHDGIAEVIERFF
ncbi:MAG: Cof-type HAD-IIB family hydrolase [Lachnospiraceae bacterium]|nr:Cof-type HAD-IIB family hydrolase [Lachnospiraceae bacterium]